MKMHLLLLLTVALACISFAEPMSTGFTYQGRLLENGEAGNGTYDLQCRLFDAKESGTQIGETLIFEDGSGADGYFTVEIDFGVEVFNGEARYLEMAFRPWDSDLPEDFVVLADRVELTPTPYALQTRGIYVGPNYLVGIGTTAPSAKLEVYTEEYLHGIKSTTGNIPVLAYRNGTTGSWPAVSGENDSAGDNTSGVRGILNSTTAGSYAAGVYGYNKATNQRGFGVYGKHDGTGAGVYGRCDNADGKGVYGHSDNGFAGYFTGGFSYFENKVGIGTTTPTFKLEVKSSGATNGMCVTSSDDQRLFRVREDTDTSSDVYICDDAGNSTIRLSGNKDTYFNGGNVGIGTTSPSALLDVDGLARVEVIQITGADVAEKFPVTEPVKPGMVVAIDTTNPGQLCLSRTEYSRTVAGVVSGANNLSAGAVLGNLPGYENAIPIALSGRVWVYCVANEKAIEPGDMLTTSSIPGHAMAVSDPARAHGAVLGKAMTPLERGQTGLVMALVNLQ